MQKTYCGEEPKNQLKGGCFRTLLFTTFTLLIIANVFVENGTVQGWKKVLRLLYGYGIGQGWGFQFLSCPCQDS
jgi:hypothetical protein